MNQAQFERWQRVRAKGKDNFVWMNGVLGWGLATGLLYGVVMHLVKYEGKLGSLWTMNFVTFLSSSLLIFAMGGYFWGRVVWNQTEKTFKKAKEKQQ